MRPGNTFGGVHPARRSIGNHVVVPAGELQAAKAYQAVRNNRGKRINYWMGDRGDAFI